jgi:hypothetical protein
MMMKRDSLATLLLEWSKMPDGLIRDKRGRNVFYRVNEEYDSETGRLISWLKSSAKKIMGWERNHNYAS